jgi:hypothetical protein
MIKISGKITGLQEMQAALTQLSPVLMDELDASARASAFMVTKTAQKSYLSGPRPGRLGVVTNRLRSSLAEGSPAFIFDVQRQQARVTVTMGTNVKYATTHEPPGGQRETVIRSKRSGGYLAVPTALAKTGTGALKDKYNMPLRQIAGLFLARSADKRTLFAAIKTPATGRQRRSGFQVLFWLVKQVKIPARPFIAPALRDSTQWITERFQQGLRRVEKRISALSRGR